MGVIDRDGFLAGAEVDGGVGKKGQKSKLKRKGLDRSSTFKGRLEKEKERGGVEGVDGVAHQQLLTCAVRLKDSLEEILVRLNFFPVQYSKYVIMCPYNYWYIGRSVE